jgi:murein DD-endopeptidase MepM/ murein hydrolase activator NlpD
MSKDIKNIINYFDLILNENKSFVDEASASSTSLFGGTTVKIPAAGAHGGQSGWQSSNAWDIMAPVGTPVYALADGVAQTFSDYGKDVVKTQGKKLYGQSFTVKSDGGLPDLYYTHLEGSPIRQGSKIQCGQFLGYIMDFPNSSSDHVHIGVSSGHKIEEFLNSDGKLKCGGGGITGQAPESPSSKTSDSVDSTKGTISKDTNSKDYSGGDPLISQVVGQFFDKTFGITESSSNKSKMYITFCNVSNLMNLKNGQKISQGSIIGKTTTDVKVTKFDEFYNKSNISKGDLNLGKNVTYSFGEALIPASDNDKIKSPISGIVNNSRFVNCKNQLTIESIVDKKEKSTTSSNVRSGSYADPLVGDLIAAPFRLFQDKYDEKGDLKQKRWGYPGEKVDPWIVDTISAPFKKIGKIFKEEETRKLKKLDENINNIKRLLK